MFTKIISLYETRKQKLSTVLKRQDLSPANKNQVFGALNEIELFLKTLRAHQQKYMEDVEAGKIPDIVHEEINEDFVSKSKLKTGIFSIFFKR